MPALDKLVQQHEAEGNLKQVRVLAHQHILGNTEGLLLKAGVKPQNTLVWGKPYSLDPRVAADLHLRGFRMQGTAVKRDARRIERYIGEQLRQVKHPERLKKPLFVIVDDGGELISIVARVVRERFPQHAHLFAAIEQTNRGLWRLQRQKLPFAVFNMAGSWAKRKYGSPMFGHAVSRETMRLLYRLQRQGLEVPKQATVMGAGNIGFNAALTLRRAGYDVLVYDKDPKKRKLARRSGFTVVADKRRALAHGHVLVSCAGGVTLTSRTLRYLPDGAVVINGASAGEFRLRDDRHVKQLVPQRRSRLSRDVVRILSDGRALGRIGGGRVLLNELPELPHQIWRTDEGKRILVARSGGVINFPLGLTDRNSGNAIPARYIQLEIGLLYLGMVQAARGGASPGINEYALQPQRYLVNTIQDQLKARSENLLWPKW
jgi:S-adenosylhomocysteine hydrolase